jgi:hypothetical protein
MSNTEIGVSTILVSFNGEWVLPMMNQQQLVVD